MRKIEAFLSAFSAFTNKPVCITHICPRSGSFVVTSPENRVFENEEKARPYLSKFEVIVTIVNPERSPNNEESEI